MPAPNAFTEPEIDTLAALGTTLQGNTEGSKITILSEVSRPPLRAQVVGGMEHRTLEWMDLLLQTAGADYLPTRQGVFPRVPSRQAARSWTAMRYGYPLAFCGDDDRGRA